MNRAPHKRLLLLVAGLQLLGGISRGQSKADGPKAPSPALQEFAVRVRQYADLHRRIERQLPALQKTSSAAEIASRRQALADAIRQARPTAVRGDILSPSVAADFHRNIQDDVQKTGTTVVGAGAPEQPDVRLRVNGDYPEGEPLSSVPPLLLSRLPALPEELEYRFVGRDLLLLDRKAGLIVDFLPAAGP